MPIKIDTEHAMNNQQGFTLVEVLVAVFILAVGLLGLAALQAASHKNNVAAYNRSQATQLAYEIADRIRANTAGIATYGDMGDDDPSSATAKSACLSAPGCTPAQMAEHDLYEWQCEVSGCDAAVPPIAAKLPKGKATLTRPSVGMIQVNIQWHDDLEGFGDAHEFQTSFRP